MELPLARYVSLLLARLGQEARQVRKALFFDDYLRISLSHPFCIESKAILPRSFRILFCIPPRFEIVQFVNVLRNVLGTEGKNERRRVVGMLSIWLIPRGADLALYSHQFKGLFWLIIHDSAPVTLLLDFTRPGCRQFGFARSRR
jgi:hypothetical protein